jgi:hypothetical protein
MRRFLAKSSEKPAQARRRSPKNTEFAVSD